MDDFLSAQSTELLNSRPAKSIAKAQAFSCPSCGGIVRVTAVGHSIRAVCNHCSSVIDVTNKHYKIITEAHKKIRNTLLTIGARGELFGTQWKIIGYTEKDNGSAEYSWDEYLLFNPYHGFRFLIQTNGHWNFFKVIKKDVGNELTPYEITLDGESYRIFERGYAYIRYIKGEFYWQAKKNEKIRIEDYISPPRMLSIEKDSDEIIVSIGEYVENSIIKEAFSATAAMPYQNGVAPNQPSRYGKHIRAIWATAMLSLLAITLIQIVSAANSDNQEVYNVESRLYSDTSKNPAMTSCQGDAGSYSNCDNTVSTSQGKLFLSPVFVMPKSSNVYIQSSATLHNDWAELNMTLMNEETKQIFYLYHNIEYYFGQDSDGYWREGGTTANGFINAVPAGNYRLIIDTDAGTYQKSGYLDFNVNIKRDVPAWSNYWITVVLVLLFPIYAIFRHFSFENKRWSESDFAPAIYQTSDE